MGSEKASPFYGFRFSSATSIDVKVSKEPEVWSGLVSICDVSVEELLRQAKTAFPDKYKQIFLAELPRMLTWGGSTEPVTDAASGEVYFSDGQIILCELEDGNSGEIEEKKITCTAEKFESTFDQSFELLNNAPEDGGDDVPKVGLDAAREGTSDDDENEEEEEGDDDENHADDDEDFKHGLGQDLRPPAGAKENAFKTQVKSVISTFKMLGVPAADIREAWIAAGGIIPEGVAPDTESPPQGGGGGGGCKAQ